jgi:hypothetical protein
VFERDGLPIFVSDQVGSFLTYGTR